MHEVEHPKLVYWGNLEGTGEERGGTGVQDERTHVYLWLFMFMYSKNHHNIATILQLK